MYPMAIEFSRDITFGQFLDLGSPIHRLDPRTKLVGAIVLMATVLAARSFLVLLPVIVILAAIQVLSQIPLSYTLRGMRLLAGTVVIIFVFQVLFYAAPADPLWRWGVVSISWAGIIQSLQIVARVLLLYHLTTTLMLTTSLVDFADGTEIGLSPLKRIGLPVNELVMTMVIALKFVPLLVSELERLVKAQAARGDSYDQGGLFQRAQKIGALLVPLFVSALARAEVLTTAMEARCYRGGRGRTKRRVLRFSTGDAIALLAVFATAASSFAIGRFLVG
jgi:energy-coupling factor transport system permease protein